MTKLIPLAAAAALCLCAGCQTGPRLKGNPADYINPTVAVVKFDNKVGGFNGWDLGDGMKDMLVDRLMATGRYHVVERGELDSVLREHQLQKAGATRTEGRVAQGRLKNVQYLIKGAVTDFGHVSASRGQAGGTSLDLLGGSSKAVMSIVLYVVEVESGEIICSKRLEKSLATRDVSVQSAYQGVSLGGTSFYTTPLGRATSDVIQRAVYEITQSIASRPWAPKIAMIQPEDELVVINGGSDRGIVMGHEFDVYENARPILDPDSGDLLGHASINKIGRLKVREVRDRLAVAFITAGQVEDFHPGQLLRRTAAPSAAR
jgi:curli biogenesis system outer membrane secretion channel CsgG